MDALFHRPGFLGTSANLAADATLVLMLLIAALFSYGAYLAKRAQSLERRPEAAARTAAGRLFSRHRWVQTAGGVLSVILVLWMMLLPYRDFVAPGLPGRLDEGFHAITTLHALVGFFAFVVGVYVILRGNRLLPPALSFDNYRPWMRAAYGLYMLTIALGVWVYIAWFVTNPNPPVY